MKSHVVIIGAGQVGTAIAYAMMMKGTARSISLVDLDTEKAKWEALDLNHGKPFVLPVDISAGGYEECKDADLIIITAGAKQKPGETRLDLVGRNIKVLKAIIQAILKHTGDNQPLLLIVSNPCDVLTYYAQKFSGYPPNRVFGSGTTLDSSRLRFEISQRLNIDPRNVHGYIVGEHGDSEVILWSSLRIGSLLFHEYVTEHEDACLEDCRKEIEQKVRNAAYTLIKLKGYTNFGIGLAVNYIAQAILRNQNTILPVSVVLQGKYGLEDVALSVPCVVNSEGIQRVLEISLDQEETKNLHGSAQELRKIIQDVEAVSESQKGNPN